MKFVKYSWGYGDDGKEKYVIVKPVAANDPEVIKIIEECNYEGSLDLEDRFWGYVIYGSKTKYEKAKRLMMFSSVKTVTNLNVDDVMKEHFVGLL